MKRGKAEDDAALVPHIMTKSGQKASTSDCAPIPVFCACAEDFVAGGGVDFRTSCTNLPCVCGFQTTAILLLFGEGFCTEVRVGRLILFCWVLFLWIFYASCRDRIYANFGKHDANLVKIFSPIQLYLAFLNDYVSFKN
jgi:hypothetical protein